MDDRAPRARIIGALHLFCCATTALGAARAQDAEPPKEPAHAVFADGQAQVVEAFSDPTQWIRETLWVETEFDSDGDGKKDRMFVDVTRQAQTETEKLKVPVVYETSPYFAGVGSTDSGFFWDPKHELGATPPARNAMPPIPFDERRRAIADSHVRTWVPRGFAVVHSESPGTGLSQGCPTIGGENESLAPKAIVDWLNGRAKGFKKSDGDEKVVAHWCTGKVGMTGTSYNGTLPIACATTGVDGLEAIIPIAPNTSYYHYYRSNGLVRHPGGYMGEDVDVLYDFVNSGDPEKRAYCNQKMRDEVLRAKADRVTGDFNEFWAGRDYVMKLAKMKAATLIAHGFNDWNVMPEHAVRFYAALKSKGVPCMAFFHQGAHGGDPPLALMNRWFTRYLYGVDNGVEKDPRSWIVREGDRRGKPTSYADYPHPDAAPVTLHPSGDGLGLGSLVFEDTVDDGAQTIVDDVSIDGTELQRAERSEHRLLFATPELTQPLHVSGTARLSIRVSADKPAVNLSVWLVPLPFAGGRDPNASIITRGWADPQNHASLTKGEPLEPAAYYELAFDLQPDDQIIPAGKRIGLMIFASDKDFTLWPKAGTKLTVDLDATTLELPVVGGKAQFEKALAPIAR